jgi:hypothetical protein
MDFALGIKHDAQEIHFGGGIADDQSRRHRMESAWWLGSC